MRKTSFGLAAAFCLAVVTGPALASPGADAALKAAEDLRGAIDAMDRATDRDDRVSALSQTIAAYETGLSALRDGLRRAAIREQEIRQDFNRKRDEIGRLLGVMTSMESSDGPLLLLHPAGPLGTARSGMILGSVTPALQKQADVLSIQLREIEEMREVQQGAINLLERGMTSVTTARTALSEAIAERSALPGRYLETPEDLQALVNSADTLEAFSSGVLTLDSDIGAPMDDFDSAKGSLPLPVMGSILRSFDEADAAGIRRPGWVIATASGALVTAPWPATIRYRGPLLDYGNVMIVEPSAGYLLVLAGLGTVYGEIGDIVPTGAPLGLMGGSSPSAEEFGTDFVRNAADGGGAGRTETLYMELRQGETPIDPADWFAQNPK
ncbi:peptidase M23 [Thioclava sp. SK-1]|uniref:murein hydrolase activator EnvC family protein n=1 Tax=Thioclava sp. SK-1 TaxID=1889770 RepID=UPI0008246BD5|nr:peptidoglycan DD-metalloendopeptidase family protein [Thioclava sp. SK-1]OCX65321.1 peptidase M23 [Thioclava sp. SK-1]